MEGVGEVRTLRMMAAAVSGAGSLLESENDLSLFGAGAR